MAAETTDEIRTKRLVVCDQQDQERLVGEVIGGVAELRMGLPSDSGARTGLLLFTNPGDRELHFGPTMGIQVWVDGNSVMELTIWQDISGDWRSTVVLDNQD